MSSKINLQTCEYARKSSIFQDNQLICHKSDDILKSTSNQISLKKALNHFMDLHRNDSPEDIDFYRSQFTATIQAIYNSVGENAFKNYSNGKFSKKFHPAIFDSLMVSAYFSISQKNTLPNVSLETHLSLLADSRFKESISKRTTDIENIKRRISIAGHTLFGVVLE